MPSKKIFLSVLFCLFFLRPFGQSTPYIFSHIDFTQGLSDNHVTCFYKDASGFMWIGTASGLNRYDGYKFKIFKYDRSDSNSIADDYIEQIFEGPDGKLWIESREGRLNTYDLSTGRFQHDYENYFRQHGLPNSYLTNIVKGRKDFWFIYEDNGLFHYVDHKDIVAIPRSNRDGRYMDSSAISSAKLDTSGDMWVIHRNGVLEKVDRRANQVVFRTHLIQRKFGSGTVTYKMFIDKQNDIWLSSQDVFKGVLYYDPLTSEIRHLSQDSGSTRLSTNAVYDILQDDNGLIWLATDHEGVNIIDKRDFSIKYLRHIGDDNKSIAENSIPQLYKDNTGIIWLATFKSGLSYYNPNTSNFPQYRRQPFTAGALTYNDINCFVEDSVGNMWIGSNGGGLIYFDRKTNTFHPFLHDPKNPRSLCNDIVVNLLFDEHHALWIATYFGGLDRYSNGTFTHYTHNDRSPTSLIDNRVMALFIDSQHRFWVGTSGGGLDAFDQNTGLFTPYSVSQPHSIWNDYVSSITEDAEQNLWVGTAYGIDVLQKASGTFVHYSKVANGLSSDNIISLLRDRRNRIWVGTREGLDLFHPETNAFQSFRKEDGLPDNTIQSIVEDQKNRLWISTSNGIAEIIEPGDGAPDDSLICRSYQEQDGLQGRNFNERSAYVTREGQVLFGGANGFNLFNPDNIVSTRVVPPIVFTDLEIFNRSINAGDKSGSHVILKTAITAAKNVTLRYSDNVFSIEFASLSFISNTKAVYKYTLENFNDTWLTTSGNARKATYTNLNPGDYTFKVMASDEDGVWNGKIATLHITILAPFWKTPGAYLFYVVCIAALLYFSRRWVIQRARMRFAVENEREEARRMHDLDMMRIRFLTNMSHELRTPLSLIMAPVERLLHNPHLRDPRVQYEVIKRNAKRLLFLVNQLLDFRKMETNELSLLPVEGDLLAFVEDIVQSFQDLAERKNIALSYHGTVPSLVVSFDHDKIERILFNLLSNAFKFTPENGTIGVDVMVSYSNKTSVVVGIAVKDTGIGIPAKNHDKIFEPFFQSEIPDKLLNQGTGLGLAITMEYVKMQGGTLSVDSTPHKGSCFSVSLPFQFVPPADPPRLLEYPKEATPVARVINGSGPSHTVLLVEDNEDVRFYLKDNLRSAYHIIEATDGKEGWQKTLSQHPDIIVSDISMPVMNGIDLCRKIKSDDRTRQIPVILLTAMTGEANELRSLDTGANDYITKPFNFEILLSKIRNHLQYSDTVKKTYQRKVEASPASIDVVSPDEQFIQEVLEVIEKNMNNPDFSVSELTKAFHSSRSTFYKRILLLTGKTPLEFIRHIRLKRAAALLEKTPMTVSEVAYTVGFNDPKYFTKFFKEEFNAVPSVYRASKKPHP